MLRLRKPTVADVPAMVAMMRPHILSERLLPRTARQVAERLRDYVVAERRSPDPEVAPVLVGVASISLVDTHLAEVGALAADEADIEVALVRHLLDEAVGMGVADAFVLTDQPALFEGLGFQRTSVALIPEKRDRQCLRCTRLPRCRQVALTARLDADRLDAGRQVDGAWSVAAK